MLTQEQNNSLRVLAKTLGPSIRTSNSALGTARFVPIDEFASTRFYIPETSDPIELLPHQISILNYALVKNPQDLEFSTIVFSTSKKSGKTAIASLVARWASETWGRSEILMMANDLEQARGRIYQKFIDSIELDPAYNSTSRELPGQWKIIEKHAIYLPNGTIVRAVSNDASGEAGSNPSLTLWSELWGFTSQRSIRLYEELTPVPTRKRSIRYVETYAGYEDESTLLLDLFKLGKQGRQLTHDDIDWPFPDQPPIWVNENARMFMYWDSGEVSHRMPWQTPAYYQEQSVNLRPNTFNRLHLNEWTSSISAFLPVEWWDACYSNTLPPLDAHTTIVLGVDAAVSSDCCAIVGVSRHPDPAKHNEVAIRLHRVWYPPKGGTINLQVVEDAIVELCANYNVVQVAYDAYQLHKMMTDLTQKGTAWCKPFGQMGSRMIADKQLYDLIRDRRLVHGCDEEFREHIRHCASKQSKEEDTRLRIIKKESAGKIDLVVAMSMAVAENLRLML